MQLQVEKANRKIFLAQGESKWPYMSLFCLEFMQWLQLCLFYSNIIAMLTDILLPL